MKDLCRGQRGFALIEFLIVVAILGIIAAVVVPSFCFHKEQAPQPAFTARGTKEMPASFNRLVSTDKGNFVAESSGVLEYGGSLKLVAGYYYEQIWVEGQEDALWVFRDDTSIILRGDVIRITTLIRELVEGGEP